MHGGALLQLRAIAETLPGYDIANWYGPPAPRGTPQAIMARLNSEVPRVLAAPDLRQGFERKAIDAFGEYMKAELVKWGRLVKSSGLRIERTSRIRQKVCHERG